MFDAEISTKTKEGYTRTCSAEDMRNMLDSESLDEYRYEGVVSRSYDSISKKEDKTWNEERFLASCRGVKRRIQPKLAAFNKIRENYLTRHPEYV